MLLDVAWLDLHNGISDALFLNLRHLALVVVLLAFNKEGELQVLPLGKLIHELRRWSIHDSSLCEHGISLVDVLDIDGGLAEHLIAALPENTNVYLIAAVVDTHLEVVLIVTLVVCFRALLTLPELLATSHVTDRDHLLLADLACGVVYLSVGEDPVNRCTNLKEQDALLAIVSTATHEAGVAEYGLAHFLDGREREQVHVDATFARFGSQRFGIDLAIVGAKLLIIPFADRISFFDFGRIDGNVGGVVIAVEADPAIVRHFGAFDGHDATDGNVVTVTTLAP